MQQYFRLGFFWAFLGCFLPAMVDAASFPEVCFILDASGSMQAMVGGKTRMEAAKDVMSQIVPGLAPEVKVGLVAYGHRRKGDCTDIEVLIPSGSADRTLLLDKVKALQPIGKTPITAAVGAVVEQLRYKENETTIVLLSDGIETCAADSCKLMQELKSTGIKFVMHVVGFGVAGQATEELSCLAKAAGGQYLAASDAQGLLNALNTVAKDIDKKVEVEKAKMINVQAKTGLGKIRITLPASATKGIAGLNITKDSTVVKKVEGLGDDTQHPLMPGEYQVDMLMATPNYGQPTVTTLGKVVVSPGETATLAMGAISFNIPDNLTKGPALERPFVSQVIVANAVTGFPVVTVNDNGNGYYNFVPKALLPGKYNVMIHYLYSPQPALAAKDVLVQQGRESVVTLDSGIRFVKVKSTDISGWDIVPLASTAKAVAEEDGGQVAAVKPLLQARPRYGSNDALWAPYLVPPGKYRLNVIVKGMPEPLTVADTLEIQPGQLLVFDSGL